MIDDKQRTMGLEKFLLSCRSIIGDGGLKTDKETRRRYARSTSGNGTAPAAVLYPESVNIIQEIVKRARTHKVVIYPISCGKNWGYGDACAPTEQAVIVDLSRMNQILELDATLGYVVVEPGVTQQQLYEYVQKKAPHFWVDCTGAGPKASVLGNALERGFGHTPYGDHVRTTCGMEAVLADGRVLKTGFGHFDNAVSNRVYPYGVGPILDGLFMQSSLGIVTKIGVWLFPVPDAFKFFYIKVEDEAGIEPLIEALRPLRMKGILNSAVHIGNDLRMISSLQRYPWEEAAGKTPLPEILRDKLRKKNGIAAWNAAGSLTGTRSQVRGAVKELKIAVRGIGKIGFIGDQKLAWAKKLVSLLNAFGLGRILKTQLEALEPNYGLLKGIPTAEPLKGIQWRLRGPVTGPSYDPLEHPCGLMWMSPVLPLQGAAAKEIMALVEPLFEQYGFELLVTFTMLNERAMVAVMNMVFDKTNEEETSRAHACYDETVKCLMEKGYVPYRVGPAGMKKLFASRSVFWDVASEIKSTLDPDHILARNRYIPYPEK